MAAWLFVSANYPGLPADMKHPAIVCDSDLLFEQAAGRPNPAAGYQRSTQTVILPTHGYEDATLGPLLAHEFTHFAQDTTHSPLSVEAMEAQAYAMQEAFAAQVRS